MAHLSIWFLFITAKRKIAVWEEGGVGERLGEGRKRKLWWRCNIGEENRKGKPTKCSNYSVKKIRKEVASCDSQSSGKTVNAIVSSRKTLPLTEFYLQLLLGEISPPRGILIHKDNKEAKCFEKRLYWCSTILCIY